jgi:HK97 family phage portal protein
MPLSLRAPGARRRPLVLGDPPERKASKTRRQVAIAAAGRPQWSTRDYATLAREGFAKNPVAYRCIRMIAEAAASVPLVVFADGARATDNPLQALIDRPNPEQSAPDLLEAFFGALQTSGNAYLEAGLQGDDNQPTELYALRPDRMTAVPGPDGWADAYDYQAGGAKVRMRRDAAGFMPVLQLKLYSPTDDYYGFSPLEAAAVAIDMHNAASAWNKSLLDNSARPSGALVYTNKDTSDRLSDEQFDRLKAELSDTYSGAQAAGRPLLLEGGLDWKPMSLTPADMDYINGKHAAAREIALAFGVPPQILGVPGDNTYANYKEANSAFWRQTIVPLVERAARSISAWLSPKFPGAMLRPDLDLVPALSVERDALWARLQAASFLTDQERRRMAGLGDDLSEISDE